MVMHTESNAMAEVLNTPATAFTESRLLKSGPLIEVAMAIKIAGERDTTSRILAFIDATGRVIDFDLRGTKRDIVVRLSPHTVTDEPLAAPRGRGRPKLGVVAREVTLLPRHWEWLAAQPGSASVTLRKLVEGAWKTGGAKQRARAAREAAYHFMSAMAGDLAGFEEAARALFAGDRLRFEERIAKWPADVRDYAVRLAFGARPADGEPIG